MYSVVGAMPGLEGSAAPAAGAAQLHCRLGATCWGLDRTSKPPRPVPYELLPGDEAPPGLAHRLLGPGSSAGGAWVLDGAAFVAATEQLPAAHLRASLENCLLECTSTRLAQLSEQPSLSTTKVNTGTAALVQLVVGAGSGGVQPLALFPPSAGLPSLAELLQAAVLPPSATSRLLSQPAVQLFAAHCAAGVGRRSAAEQYDMGSMPSLYDRARSHARAAACRGGTFYTLLSGPPLWQRFHVQSGASGGGASGNKAAGASAASQPAGKAAGKKQPRQKRKQEAVAAGAAAAAAAAAVPQASRPQAQPPVGSRPPLEPGTLVHSACSCCHPDLGVLWCSHRYDAMHALLSDPALHVVDCDALEALLAPLSQRQLAQLLLTVAFACGTLPDVLLSLQLPAGRQSALFLPRLGSLSLAVPTAAELRMCCHTPADATQAAYYGPGEPYMNTQRDAATTCSNPLAAAHTASRLSVLSGAEGSAVQGVDKRVRVLTPELCWHLKGMGVDALDSYPESLATANAAGIWPVDVRAGATLGFEDALGLTRALSLLGGSYTPIAQQLLKDLTVTVAHPHYCTAALPATAQPAFVRRLVALWKQLMTPAERWSLFMEGGMRLPSVWSSVVLELAWEAVGQFATMCAMFRQAVVMGRCTPRAAAMALLTRSTLLPRGGAAAGASAMTDLLLFERSMRRGFLDHLQGVVAFLKPRLASLRPPREGSLLQLAARSYGRQLMNGKQPLPQAHAAFQELILDLQEAVLAESARFLTTVCEQEMAAPPPAPGTPEAAQPSDLRAAGPSLKGHTIGVLNTGHSFNANGLQRHALPAHLPPALTSSPFSWVTLDVGAMLADPVKEPDAPAWVCAYLTLAPKYSPAGAVPLWAWLRAGGMLGRLLSAASSSVLRRDWHTAAMLCDAAHKYLSSSISLAAAGAASEQQQLTALRPVLRTLALSAAGQMRQCLALHRDGAVLTHTSSLRACCLLLRSVLSLTAELLDPALLQPSAAAAHAAVDALAAEIQEFAADVPPDGVPHQLQPGLAQIHLQQAMLEQVAAAHQHMQQAAQQAAQAEGLVPPPLPGLSPAAAAAAAVAGGGGGAGPMQQLALPAAEALAQDARMLMLVAQVVMDLASATIDAPPLLPLASGSATAATSAVARRAMHDTALWRAVEVSSELGQYPYEHNPVQDETHPRSFLLNDVALLLAQQLPVALLPLQQAAPRTAAAAGGAVGPAGSQQQQQQQPQAGQPQAAQPSRDGGPETRSRSQRSQEAATQASPAAGASAALAARQRLAGWQENALLGALPLLDQLIGRLLDNFDGPPKSRADSAVGSIRYRFKSSAFLSLAVTLLRLAASSGEQGPCQLAALPNAWKLLCSYVMEVAASSPASSFHLRLFALAPPTLLSMLQACTVKGGAGQGAAAAAQPATAAAAGKEEGEEEEAQPPSKRRRRSSRQRGSDPGPSGRRSSASGRSSLAGDASRAADSEAAAGTLAAAAAAAAEPTPVVQPGPARICVGEKALEIATVQRAVQRVLNWLGTGVQEHWRASSYTQWRPRAVVPPPPQQQQQQQQQQGGGGAAAPAAPAAGDAAAAAGQVGPAAAAAAAAGLPGAGQQQGGQPPAGIALNMNNAAQALAAAAMNGAAAFDMLAAANLEEQMMAADAEAAEFGLPPHMLPPLHMPPHMPPHMLGVAAAAVAAGLAGMAGALGAGGGGPPRPRRAFEPRSRTSAMAAALTSGWPASAVGVLHWWLRHRTLLQGPEFVTGPVGSEAAAVDAEEDTKAAAAAAIVGGQPDSRSRSFFTLDGPVVQLAHLHEPAPKLGLLCGTLLSLLCMECAPEVHTAAAAALQGAAQQPAAAQAIAECGSFWALSRLLLREDLPAGLKALGCQVVGGVKQTLLAQSGDWAAVFSTQHAVATDAEELAAERRARAAEAVAARAAEAPGGGAVLPPPPEWFLQMGLFPGHLPPMMMGEFDDEFDEDGSDEEDEDDMSEDEEGPFMDEDDLMDQGLMGGPPGGFFF